MVGKTKTIFKKQTNGKDKVDTYFPISRLTAKSVNPKVYRKAPQAIFKCGALMGGLADTFLFVSGHCRATPNKL